MERIFWLAPALAGLLFLSACGKEQAAQSAAVGVTVTELRELNLTEELRIGEDTGVIFGGITDLEAGADGTIYVADPEYHMIRAFSPSGDSLASIGGEGEGPGEFTRVSALEVGPGDSLYVFDRWQNRISVFSPGGTFAYSVPVSSEGVGYPSRMMKPDTAGFLIQYSIPYSTREREVEHNRWVSWMDARGEVKTDSILVVPGNEALVRRGDGSVTVLDRPFGRSALIQVGPRNTIYYGWTDSVSIGAYTLSGEESGRFRLAAEPVPVTKADIEEQVARFEDSPIADRARSMIRGADLADTKPAFQNLVVSDRGRLWIDVVTADEEQSVWKVGDPAQMTAREVVLPAGVSIRSVRGGKVYTTQADDRGIQEVVVYQIQEPV